MHPALQHYTVWYVCGAGKAGFTSERERGVQERGEAERMVHFDTV